MHLPYDLSKVNALDLFQNFPMDSPAFAFYERPTVKWLAPVQHLFSGSGAIGPGLRGAH
ncbi:MAG: hypothetical protein ABIV06_06565 [Thermoanaerobaculia bacterium]